MNSAKEIAVPVTQDQLAAETEGQVASVSYDPSTDTSTVTLNNEAEKPVASEVPQVPEDSAPYNAPEQIPAEGEAVKIHDPFATAEAEKAPEVVQPKEEVKQEVAEEPKPVEIKSEEPTVEEVKKQVENAVKTEVTKETDKRTGEEKTVIEFKQKPKSMGGGSAPAAAPASSGAGSYYVQVSSHSTRAEANSAWLKFVKSHSSEVGGKKSNVTEANVSGKTFYRLSFGPFSDKSDASTKCGILKANGQDCIIQKY